MKLSRFLFIAIILCISSMANAQTVQQAEANAKDKTEKLTTAIDLTDNQQVMAYRQIYEMELNTMKFNAIEDMTPQMTAYYEQYQQQFIENMLAILTDEQKASFEKVWDKKINK
jgi:purine nucleoside permease